MKYPKFYICRHCGNLIEMVQDADVNPVCCGEDMEELIPNTVDASGEKHIPVVQVEGDVLSVHVGSVDHPMAQEHWIEWIQLQTETGSHRRHLEPGSQPHVTFPLGGETPVAVYAYCNLHGLWKTEL